MWTTSKKYMLLTNLRIKQLFLVINFTILRAVPGYSYHLANNLSQQLKQLLSIWYLIADGHYLVLQAGFTIYFFTVYSIIVAKNWHYYEYANVW